MQKRKRKRKQPRDPSARGAGRGALRPSAFALRPPRSGTTRVARWRWRRRRGARALDSRALANALNDHRVANRPLMTDMGMCMFVCVDLVLST
jgi:hypothetical protein